GRELRPEDILASEARECLDRRREGREELASNVDLARHLVEEIDALLDLCREGRCSHQLALADLDRIVKCERIDTRLTQRPFESDTEIRCPATKQAVGTDRTGQPEGITDHVVANANSETKTRLEDDAATEKRSIHVDE